MKTSSRVSLIAAILLCAGPSLQAGETLTLENPGFEKQFVGWNPYADNGKSVVVAEAAHSGKLGLRVTDESDTDGCMIESAKLACKPGNHYEATFWSRFIAGEGAAVHLKFYDAADQEVAPDAVGAVPADAKQWKQVSVKAQAPAGAVKVMLWIHTGNAAKVTVDFDDLVLRSLD